MITANLRFALLDMMTGAIGQTTATFAYDPDDPFAVQMTFHRDDDTNTTWYVSRDLLAGALAGHHCGHGDIRVWCIANTFGIDLLSDDGQARLGGRTNEVRAFVARTYHLVPQGSEHLRFNHDALINHLLKGAGQ